MGLMLSLQWNSSADLVKAFDGLWTDVFSFMTACTFPPLSFRFILHLKQLKLIRGKDPD